MAQTGSSGVFKVGQLLLKGGVRVLTGAGAPTSGTGGAFYKAGPGTIYVRTSNGAVYANTNTAASPTWGQLGTVAALTSAHIFVGNGSNAAADVAMSGDVTIANTGAATIGAKKVLASMVALANHKIFIGDAGDAAAEMAVTGDVTISDSGVTAVGAGKVTNAMIVPAALDGTVAKVVADVNVIGGIPVVHTIALSAGALADTDVVLTHKTRVIDAQVVLQGAGVANTVITVKNGATAITDGIAASGTDKAMTRAATLDDAQWEIAASGTLRVTSSVGATQPACTVIVHGFRVT
jgi:hypothetical protein